MASSTAKRRFKTSPKEVPAPRNPDRSGWLVTVILIVAALAAFWPVCTNDFTTWDDNFNVSQNPRLNPVTLDGVLYFWTHPHMAIFIPLTYTVWAMLASIARVAPDSSGISLNPYIFHTANLLVHVAAVLVAYRFLHLLTRSKWAAVGGALLFALHPLQVESVAWVAGMKDLLCGALSLVALWQYALFAGSGEPGLPRSDLMRRLHYAAATLAFILAMLGKPSAMTLPLAALVLDRFLFRRSWRDSAMALAPWFVLALACAVMAKLFQPVSIPPEGGRLWARPLLAGDALAFYLWKLIWPARLAVQYPHSPQIVLAGRWIWFAWMVPTGVGICAWVFRRRWPWLIASLGLFVAATLPVLGLVPFQFERLSLVADHYLYFAMIGPSLALCFLLASIRHARIAGAICAVILIAFGVRSNLRTWHWRDTVTLFTHELAVNPYSEVAYNSLAERAVIAKQPQLAEKLAGESIRLNGQQGEAYITLGSALALQGKRDDALAAYRRACELSPENPVALNDLAGVLADRGQIDEAMQLCRKSLQLDDSSAPAHRNLAMMLAQQNHLTEALGEAEIAAQLDPASVECQMTRAYLLAVTGHRDAAIQRLQQLLSANPDFAPARRLLADLTGPSR